MESKEKRRERVRREHGPNYESYLEEYSELAIASLTRDLTEQEAIRIEELKDNIDLVDDARDGERLDWLERLLLPTDSDKT